MKRKIEDVRNALQNKCYYCAVALALTFPDICCHVENNLRDDENTKGKMYIDWFDNNIDEKSFQILTDGFEDQTFDGEMCYALRCKVLHNGNTNVQNRKINPIPVDEFKLVIPGDDSYFHGFRYGSDTLDDGSEKKYVYIGIDYLCEELCNITEKYYDNYEPKSDFEVHSF